MKCEKCKYFDECKSFIEELYAEDKDFTGTKTEFFDKIFDICSDKTNCDDSAQK